MISELQRAFDALIQSGELGKTDAQYINTLLPSISGEGLISKDEVIRQLFAGSKNPDGACRNFFSRIHAAAAQAAEAAQEQGDERRAAMFRSIDIRKSSAAAGMMQFSACAPKELPPVTARANRDYLPENYQPSTGCKPEDLPQLQREELSRRQEKAEEKRQCCLLEAGRKELYECHEFIEVRGERTEIHTAGERHLLRDRAEDEGRGKYREALVDLFDWLENSEASLYALLGDYGMGKTFTCRIFAQRLAERCENEPQLPKPVYLDLRDVPTFVTVNGKTRQPTLEEMLETVLRLNGQDEEYTAKELISAARQGKVLCIFDGLDEKLVYYTADMCSQFLNEILFVFPQVAKKQDYQSIATKKINSFPSIKIGKSGKNIKSIAKSIVMAFIYDNKFLSDELLHSLPLEYRSNTNDLLIILKEKRNSAEENIKQNSQIKILFSCRSHHFETIRHMHSFLLGLNRNGLYEGDYRALHLLPFSAEQMQALLTKLLGTEEAAQIFAFIEDEAYLKDLAQRPFLLRQLSRLLPKLRELKKQGKPINASGFYQALIEDCLARDEEKNLIKSRHKQQLLADLAAEFWQRSTQLCQIDQLNDWFCSWLSKRPNLAAQYSSIDDRLLEKDLRNSTLLVRFGEKDFGFSHSSMQEYFFSKWLIRQWQEGQEIRLQQPLSSLTTMFLFDQLTLLTVQELEQLNKGLALTLSQPFSSASYLVLNIISMQMKKGNPATKLTIIDLRGANLNGKKIYGLTGETLLLDYADAYESKWISCSLKNIEVGRGKINKSIWIGCCWQNFDVNLSVPDFIKFVTMINCKSIASLPELHIFPAIQQDKVSADLFSIDFKHKYNRSYAVA